MRKKFLSALLALCMALTILPTTAFAGFYGDRLTGDEKTIYDALETGIADVRDGKTVNYTETVQTTQAQARLDALSKSATSAAYAFKTDHPEIFWLGSEVKSSGNGSSTGATMDITVGTTISFGVNWAAGGNRTITADQTALNAAINTIVTEAQKETSVYDALKYAHDWLTSHNAYNTPAAANNNFSKTDATPWSAVSALLGSNLKPVCEGYSKAFKLICDELGVPCILVSGKGNGGDHMWNYVQIDSIWYAVDVTWDDPTVNGADTNGVDTYFLVGSNTCDKDSKTFGTTHVPDNKLPYPELSASKFDNSKPAAKTPVTIHVPATLSVVAGATSSINAATSPANLPLTCTSSDNSVATVNASGVVTGVAAGSAVITVSYAGDATHDSAAATVNVTVTAAPVTMTDWDFNVTANPASIQVGENSQINVTGADKEGVALSVSDTELAEINSGVLTAKKEGIVTVTAAKAGDSTHNAATKTVTVTISKKADDPAPPSKVKPVLTVDPPFLMVHVGDPVTKDNFTVTARDGGTEVQGTWEIVGSVDTSVQNDIPVTIKFKPNDSSKYEETTEEVTVAVLPPVTEEKELPTVSVKPITVTKGTDITTADIANNGTAVNAAGDVLTGKWEFVGQVPTAVGTHSVAVKFVPDGTDLYKEAETTVDITITKADEPAPPPVTPAEPVEPRVSVRDIVVEYGTPVTNASIMGTATVAGTWAFTGAVPTAVGEHIMTVRFTPADTAKYKAVETTLTLNITKRWTGYTLPAISGVKVAVNDRPFSTSIPVPSRPGEGSEGTYVLNVEINAGINAAVTLQNLLEQMFKGSVWSGDVYYTSRARAGMRNGHIGYWHGDTRRFVPDADVGDVSLADGFFTLAPADTDYAVMTLLVVNHDTDAGDLETYYISIPSLTGGEIIPTTRYAAYGERVTLNVHPESGYELDSLTVRDIHGRTLAAREIGSDHSQYAFNMPSCKVEVEAVFVKRGAAPAVPPAPSDPNAGEPFAGLGTPGISGIVLNPASMPFSDVKSSDWYYNYVEYMWKHYLMSGTSDTRFEPDLTTSRAMIWTIMARMNNVRTDINPGSTWYERGMLWAMEQGVTDGTDPMGNITREQLVTMLWRNAGKPGAGVATLNQFSDASSVSGYAEAAVRWAVGAGVLTGDNGRINPQGTATRAQVAAMIARYGDKAA